MYKQNTKSKKYNFTRGQKMPEVCDLQNHV